MATMKGGMPSGIHPGIHKRLYTVLPRPSAVPSPQHHHRLRSRSNSASLHTTSHLLPLSFFDSPASAPSSSRLPSTSPRIPGEPKQQTNHPNPLALTPSPPADDGTSSQTQLLLSNLPYPYPTHPTYDFHLNSATLYHQNKRPRTRYQLDSGAYGIPKRCRPSHRPFQTRALDPLHLSVQVGEDAYFIRQNAMGVADGVGGWARTHPSDPNSPPTPSPSALFARRLMHFTSAQLDPSPDYLVDPGPVQDLDSHLTDLQDGIDILQILESAYDQTVKAHVQPSTSIPLHMGSSTALVAVLDNIDEPVLKIANIGDCMAMLVRGDDIVWRSEEMWWAFNTPVQLSPPPRSPASSSTFSSIFSTPSISLERSADASPTRALSILPQRLPLPRFSVASQPSERPLASSVTASLKVTPRTTAHTITLPVHADDILILASDGLSDNLWDEDVLDEVLRFRRMWSTTIENGEVTDNHGTIKGTLGTRISTATATTSELESRPVHQVQRHTLAGMLSEALCSRARCVAEQRPAPSFVPSATDGPPTEAYCTPSSPDPISAVDITTETPFARRARELGKSFVGGKRDDISVLVAIVSPVSG